MQMDFWYDAMLLEMCEAELDVTALLEEDAEATVGPEATPEEGNPHRAPGPSAT